jgi:toxin YoeB
VKTAFTDKGWEHYTYWCEQDGKMLARINELIRDAKNQPFTGIGKPEPLRSELTGWWSRRITQEHRLVYRVTGSGDAQILEVAACRFHY